MKLLMLTVASLLLVTPALAELNIGPIYQNGKVWVPMFGDHEETDLGFGHWENNPKAKADERKQRKEIKSFKKLLDSTNGKE